jgi:hypothetical protein
MDAVAIAAQRLLISTKCASISCATVGALAAGFFVVRFLVTVGFAGIVASFAISR